MILLLACTGAAQPDAESPESTAFAGTPELTDAQLTCAGATQRWLVAGRGVADLTLRLSGSLAVPPADSADTGAGSLPIDELHEVPLQDQDPAGWWAAYALDLQYAPEQPGVGNSAAPCTRVEDELSWTLALSRDGEALDCIGSCT